MPFRANISGQTFWPDDQWLEKRSDSKFGLLLCNGASYALTQNDGLRF